MAYSASILADSIGPHGKRITTFEVTFPRMVLADMTRHRALSYSFESTRAVPPEKRVVQLKEDPYLPDLRQRAKGMGGGEPWSPGVLAQKQIDWLVARDRAVEQAEKLMDCGKEHVGRLLEPFSWITGIITGTEWENYFSLRCPPPGEEPHPKHPAQIELQVIAHMQEKLYRESEPDQLFYGQWHLPLVSKDDKREFKRRRESINFNWVDPHTLAYASAGRCAAVSYLNHHRGEDLDASVERWNTKLRPSAHWSPGEHPAQCLNPSKDEPTGNFSGWKQLRKFYPQEAIRPRYIEG